MENKTSVQRFNGLSFDFDLGEFAVQAKKFTLDITDNSKAATRNGRPDGYLIGDVSGSGTITVDRVGLKMVTDAAKSAGSFQDLPPCDINSYAKAGDNEFKVEAFGCKLKISKLLDVDKGNSEETQFELPYDITSPDFVRIDGVPYAKPATETK